MHDTRAHLCSAEDHAQYLARTEPLRAYKRHVLPALLKPRWPRRRKPKLPGFSVPAGQIVAFFMDPEVRLDDGSYNLRENIKCPLTAFYCRMRAAIHAVMEHETDLSAQAYINEQKTHLYRFFNERFSNLHGSEYLGDGLPLGQTDASGLRNEDATRLTYADNSFDLAMSFEVLEHIPDFAAALSETHRTLRPGGRFYFTAPFIPTRDEHLIRAKLEDGKIHHILEPEMHGDPVTGEGILCFQHFGWQILRDLEAAGFQSAYALAYDEVEYGYYTQDPILIFRAVA